MLIQVVPRLLPGKCGVSDQALHLATHLRDGFGIDSGFLVANSNERRDVPFRTIFCPQARLLESCVELVAGHPAGILVHVSGYGYSPDGAPLELAKALENIRKDGRFPVAAYFHENFAIGPPWKSAFWYSRRQKTALRRIIAQCGLIATNIARHAEWLERESRILGGVPVDRMPVFSAAGETDPLAPFERRNPAMVVFGLPGSRKAAYQKLAAAQDLVQTLGIQEILDIGPEIDPPSHVGNVQVKRVGWLSIEELSQVFSSAQFGFVTHDWFCLGKSSVFASYCAQGTIPVLAGPFPEEIDGLQDGVQVVTPRTAESVRNSGWESCSRAAWTWYMGHRLRVHAERYAKWLGAVA
jgi:hypothetical protein